MLTDYVHKALQPSSYACSLCKLTHTNIGMKKEWQQFIKSLNGINTFLYKDEFIKKYPEYSSITVPAVFIEDKGTLHELLGSKALDSYLSLSDLQNALTNKLSEYDQYYHSNL